MAALHHRGPDHSSYWVDTDKGVFLGHTRLSIIDLSELSNQPMVRNGAVLAYNGEIYNYKELAEELSAQGVALTTTGDAEVLLQAWHSWGGACVDRFDGMFAFALYDGTKVHLFTDPFGEKPMYWAEAAGGVYFASEPGPLVELLNLRADFSAEEITLFLSLGFLPGVSTGYEGLKRMPPATLLTVSPDGETRMETYWSAPEPEVSTGPVKELSEKDLDFVTEALVDSLRVRLRSDVPLGIFLSSGVDSSLVAALAAKELNQDTLAFTVKFPARQVADESERAAAIARFLGLPHEVVDSLGDPEGTDPYLMFDLYGEANDNLTVIPAYQMSLTASSTLKVALSGLGGDEVFYGYNKYQFLYRVRSWLAMNEKVRRLMSAAYRDFLPRRWIPFRDLLSASTACRFIAAKNLPVWRWLSGLPHVEDSARALFPDNGIPVELYGRHFDLTHTLPLSYIPAMERASMRASLEVRTPYLNRRLLEVISGFDQRALLAFGQKSVLRRILGRYLPKELYDAPKIGFNYPPGEFLDRFSESPRIPQLPGSKLETAWQNRRLDGWQTLGVRLVTLDHFINDKGRSGGTRSDSDDGLRESEMVKRSPAATASLRSARGSAPRTQQ